MSGFSFRSFPAAFAIALAAMPAIAGIQSLAATSGGLVWHYIPHGTPPFYEWAELIGVERPDDPSNHLKFPSMVGELPVKRISAPTWDGEPPDWEFCNLAYAWELISISIPSCVETIGESVFHAIWGLESVSFSEGLKSFEGEWADFDHGMGPFWQCGDLKSAIIPNSVTNIAPGTFMMCESLADDIVLGVGKLSAGNGLEIGDRAFEYTAIKKVVLGDRVTRVGGYAFETCENLETVDVGHNAKFIGQYGEPAWNVFGGCSSLRRLRFAARLDVESPRMFSGCTNLSDVVLKPGVENICRGMFQGCAALESIFIPNTVTNIGASAFMIDGAYVSGEPRLAKLRIPASVASIGNDAFAGQTALRKLLLHEDCPVSETDLLDRCGLSPGCEIVRWKEGKQTATTPVPVPAEWIEDRAGTVLSAAGGDREAAARATAANGRPVWECYVADLDPENPEDDLKVAIRMVDGKPEPFILSGESAARKYEMQGAPAPEGPWGEVAENSRFFRVKVGLPEGE